MSSSSITIHMWAVTMKVQPPGAEVEGTPTSHIEGEGERQVSGEHISKFCLNTAYKGELFV